MDSARNLEELLPEQGTGQTAPASDCLPQPAGAILAQPARGFVRFLYSSNPFYILSADLVFVGLRISFGPRGPAAYPWALGMSLAGYTLLLATTACFLIRVGKLWDDLRSLLLLIVMMFLAIATSGDDKMAADSLRGAIGYLIGFCFAVVLSEIVLHTIRLRLPGWYRAAYHAILALVFLYPIALVPLLNEPESPRLQWALFGFSPLATLVLLLLVPAARGGAAYVAKNGSPWRWPLYPWSLFLIMAGGLAVRSYSLCMSFHYVNGSRTIFAPYFLVPVGLAVSLIWLEIGIAGRRRGVMIAASVVPFLLAYVATTGHRYEPVYLSFWTEFRNTLGGTPFYLAAVAVVLFQFYAVIRRVPAAWDFLWVSLALLSAIGRNSLDFDALVAPDHYRWSPPGLVLARLAWRRRDTIEALLSGTALSIAIARSCTIIWPEVDSFLVAAHLIVVTFMAVGAVPDDIAARFARTWACFALLVLQLFAVLGYEPLVDALTPNGVPIYVAAITGVGIAYGFRLRDRRYVAVAAAGLAAWLAQSGAPNYKQLRRILVGLDQIACGLLFFIVAGAISLRKAGIWPRSLPKSLAWLFRR